MSYFDEIKMIERYRDFLLENKAERFNKGSVQWRKWAQKETSGAELERNGKLLAMQIIWSLKNDELE